MKIQRIKSRCNLCLLCVRECVAGAWRTVDGEPVMAAPDLCNRCAHCVAVCPNEAVYHEALDYSQVQGTIGGTLHPDVYHDIVRSRRSIRQYKSKSVPADVIEHILDVARHSPTASNMQNVAYTVISDKAMLNDFSERVFGVSRALYEKTRSGAGRWFYRIMKWIDPYTVTRYLDPMDHFISEKEKGRNYILHDAPVLILIHGPKRGSFISENCNIAAANLMNYAHALGLGTCYIGFLVLALKLSGALRKQAQVPKKRRVYAAIVLGYPAYHHPFTASRKKTGIQWIGEETREESGRYH